ncbi:TatD family hydrolase [Psychroflexus sp. ALD_RP9]|uniref:TatD family hydrolase n=1 Tax=Psychroflexus sp. ALD_RP9 TaxID=2777186 RepID=UPI001A8D1AA4|nr:TatD family hydrolase [Psychroflexus sp. ALD_RP9]QSS97775.1 TatD family hydrolase [Psychroflexus sp. ALD_RP9]
MNFIDTHTHLYVEDFDEDIEAVVNRALKNNITKFCLPAIDSKTSKAMLDLQLKFPENMHIMAGLHPTSVNKNYNKELEHVEQQLQKHNCVAVGEIGIDLYWDQRFLCEQQDAFKAQIKLAKQNNLPIVIHCREAFDEVFEVLESEKSDDLFGIFHCFTGTLEQAKRAIDLNMKIGLGGVLTFKNGKIDQYMHLIDLKHIVLETDAPYLAPKPYRGKRNESSYLIKVAEKLAEIHNRSLEEIAKITTQNAEAIFKI